MDIKARILELTSHEIDRTEFLRNMGVAFLAIIGLSMFIKQRKQQPKAGSRGFGTTINLKTRR